MRAILSFFLVLLFVTGCSPDGGDIVRDFVERIEDALEDGFEEEEEKEEPSEPVATPSCASPPFTESFTGAFFTDGLDILCSLGSVRSIAAVVCDDGFNSIGLAGNVVTGTRASIDTTWADTNNNGIVDRSEIVTSSLISGNLNLENNRATMSVTNLRISTDFWSVYFRGNCTEVISSASALYGEGGEVEGRGVEETLEWLEEMVDSFLDTLEQE